jgi:predicted dehydrogenase
MQVPEYSDLEGFLQAAAPELVVITTPTHTHYRSVAAGPPCRFSNTL